MWGPIALTGFLFVALAVFWLARKAYRHYERVLDRIVDEALNHDVDPTTGRRWITPAHEAAHWAEDAREDQYDAEQDR